MNIEEQLVKREVLPQVVMAGNQCGSDIQTAADTQGCLSEEFLSIYHHIFSFRFIVVLGSPNSYRLANKKHDISQNTAHVVICRGQWVTFRKIHSTRRQRERHFSQAVSPNSERVLTSTEA
ncbi:MAG: hypothetical protein ACK5PS_01295 [Desulfopila sp.]